MKLIVNKDRTTVAVGTWGTKNENDYEILEFEFPEELENYNKRIVYYLGNERVWDTIVDNKAYITNAITQYSKVKAYVWLTKENTEREADTDFRTKLFEMKFYDNDNADGIVPTEQQVDGFNTMLTAMNRKIDEVNALEQTILQAETERQENENTRISNESTRQSNESTRQTNEQTRQSQETDRERRTDEAIADIEDKTAEYNANAEEKTTTFNTNATTQTTDFNSNAETKTNAFNTNATNKTNDFNSNSTEKTTAFNDNVSTQTTEFNSNAESKTTEFNTNATNKTNDFNTNADEKTDEFNTNAQNKIDEYDEHIVDYQAQIDELQEEVEELSENMPWNTTEQATEISVDDAAKYSKNKLELFGNTEQDNTKMTYKCDGTEAGDYYLTYDSTDYYFTMPTITEGDILVFDTTDLKLYLADTEITTESTGTGTNLTFISSPSPDYPQDIHVVKGHNVIDFKTDLFVMANNLQNGKTFRTGTDIMGNDQYCAICLDYLPIITGKQYDMETQNGIRWLRLNFYDKNKTLLRWTYFDANTNYSFTPKKNEAYIRFSMRREDYNTLQILYIARTLELDLPEGIELCKIGDYQDKFVKDNGVWKIPNKIVKIDSYNGETITTPYISTTGGLDIGATIYYVGNAEYTITDETLVSQLDEIYENLKLVKGTNNITVTASDLAPNMQLSYMQDLKSKLDNLDSRLSLLE